MKNKNQKENWEKSTNKQIRHWNSLKGIKNEKKNETE